MLTSGHGPPFEPFAGVPEKHVEITVQTSK